MEMTPDEYDQFRREAIEWRVMFAGNKAITERLNNALGLFKERLDPVSPKHKADIEAKLRILMPELRAEIERTRGTTQ